MKKSICLEEQIAIDCGRVLKPEAQAKNTTLCPSLALQASIGRYIRPHSALICSFLALLLISAAPQQRAKDLVREGNDAFQQELLDDALQLYEQAEGRITDPGLVAYNEAVTLYRLGHYREAEMHFRRSSEGAGPARRLRSLYGVGNALVMQAGEQDVQALEDAVECYRLCRQQRGIDEAMLQKVNHNLELARLLLIKAQANQKKQQKSPGQNGGSPQKNQGRAGKKGAQNPDGQPGQNTPKQFGEKDGQQQDGKAHETDQTVPGKGRIRVLPDEGEPISIDPEDLEDYLQRAIRRIEREREKSWRSAAPSSKNVKDW